MVKIGYLAVLMLVGLSCTALAAPIIKVEDPVWQVGIVVAGQTYEKVVVVENAGNEPLIIEKVEQCCGFFGTLPEGLRLRPGEKANVQLQLSPFKMVGDLNAEIFLISNDPAQPRFSLFAVGQVVPKTHALGELTASEIDLGRIGMRDRIPFSVRIRNVGNTPLEILQVGRPPSVLEVGSRPVIAVAGEGELKFEYAPRQSGGIEDRITIETNDALERSLTVQLKGEVVREYVSEQTISIYPPGGKVPYDVIAKAYRFDFTVSNRGPVLIEIPMIESSIQGAKIEIAQHVEAGESVKGSVTFPNGAAAAPAKGWIYLQLAIPVEIQ